MNKAINPDGVAPPFSLYSHAVVTPAGARVLQVSGQVGVARDGSIATGFAAQAAQVWANIVEILKAADMGVRDLVKVNTFLVNRDDLAASRAARDGVLQGHRPASTLVFVSGLANPAWLIEVEVIAAKGSATRAAAKPAKRAKPKARGRRS
jgi:enamine deaminase RidA (YjgF/YER057c/UK114 family)